MLQGAGGWICPPAASNPLLRVCGSTSCLSPRVDLGRVRLWLRVRYGSAVVPRSRASRSPGDPLAAFAVRGFSGHPVDAMAVLGVCSIAQEIEHRDRVIGICCRPGAASLSAATLRQRLTPPSAAVPSVGGARPEHDNWDQQQGRGKPSRFAVHPNLATDKRESDASRVALTTSARSTKPGQIVALPALRSM